MVCLFISGFESFTQKKTVSKSYKNMNSYFLWNLTVIPGRIICGRRSRRRTTRRRNKWTWNMFRLPIFSSFIFLKKKTLWPFFNKTCKETEDKLWSAWSWSTIIWISLRFNIPQVKQRSIKYRQNCRPEGKDKLRKNHSW